MKLLPLILLLLSAIPASSAEVSLGVRREPVVWLVDPARYGRAASQWLDDTTLLIQSVALETGESSIQEAGAVATVSGPALVLEYLRCPVHYAQGQPIPSAAIPVLLEWRVKMLPHREFDISVSAHDRDCKR